MPRENFTKEAEMDCDPDFASAAKRVTEKLFDVVTRRYDQAKKPLELLPFHNSGHSRDVWRRARSILASLLETGVLSKRQAFLGELASAGHDTRQGFTIAVIGEEGSDDRLYGKMLRRRSRGENEEKSADDVITLMREANAVGRNVFTAEDEELVRTIILATIPDYDLAFATVVQPRVTPDSLPVARAVALADIGTAGMDGAESFIKEGDKLFREEQLDMHGLSIKELDEKAKAYYKKRMVDWLASQIKFAEGRKALLETEIDGLPEAAKIKLRMLFSHFDESIEAVTARNTRATRLSFEELYQDMGFVPREKGGRPLIDRAEHH